MKRPFVIILLITIIGSISIGFFIARQQSQLVAGQKEDELVAVARLKVKDIVEWRKDRLSYALLVSENPFLFGPVRAALAGHAPPSTLKELKAAMIFLTRHYQYQNIILAKSNGRVILSTSPTVLVLTSEDTELLKTAALKHRPLLSDLHFSDRGKIYMDLIVPVDGTRGAFVLRLDPLDYLYPLIQSWPTHSRSAETLLVHREGNEVVFLNELRHRQGTAMKLRFPLTKKDLPAAEAILQNKEKVIKGADYRGVPVIAFISPIPDSPWFIVSKVDAAEIFAPVSFTIIIVTVIFVGVILLVSMVLVFLAQRQIELALFGEKERFRITLHSIGDGVMVVDPAGKVSLLNRAAEELTGWTNKEAGGRPFAQVFNIVNERTRQLQENPLAKALETKKVVLMANHTVLIAKDGREKSIADSAAPIFDSGNNLLGAVMVFRDVTEQQLIEKELSQRSQAVVQNPASIVVTDPEGKIEYVNPKFSELSGYTMEEARGKTPRILKSGYHPPEFYQELWATIKAGRIWRGELHDKKKNGELYWEFASISPIKDEDGKIINFVAVKEDITERKRAEAELEELYKVKSNFTSTVSHEMRTPLTAIKEGIGIVLDGTAGQLNSQQHEFLDLAKRNVDRLHRLINDVLDFSKLEANVLQLKLAPEDLSALVQETIKGLRQPAETKGLKVNVEIESGLPLVKLDRDRIVQVLTNLFDNAVKFTAKGSITVQVRPDEVSPGLKVCVADTGVGIAAEDIPKLFQKFQQLGGPANRKTGGTGLGLAICKEIIKQHHGNIWIDSEPGKGSSFCFNLPLS